MRCGAVEGEDLPDMGRVWNPRLPCCGWWSGVEVLGTIPGEVWRRPAPGLRIVGSGMLSPLWRFKASIVARSSFSSESCRERTEHFWKRLKTFKYSTPFWSKTEEYKVIFLYLSLLENCILLEILIVVVDFICETQSAYSSFISDITNIWIISIAKTKAN